MDLVHRAVSHPARDGGYSSARGFSMIEVLIAAVILLVILLGIVPLFLRASVNRQAGRESTSVASYARSQAEALLQLPFDHEDVSVPAGQDALSVVEYLVPDSHDWSDDGSLAGDAQWVRTTRVEQFGTADLLDGDTDGDGDSLDTPLPGGTDPRSVQLKQIEVAVTSPREGGAFGAGQEMTVRVLKAF
jgi:prepilin-type N-terminal cleavage/methylation domain-containing protein